MLWVQVHPCPHSYVEVLTSGAPACDWFGERAIADVFS